MSGCEHGDETGMWPRDPGPYAPVSPPAVSSTLRDQLFVLSQSSSHGSTPSPPPPASDDAVAAAGHPVSSAAAAAVIVAGHKVPTSRILPLKRPRRVLGNSNNNSNSNVPSTAAGAAQGAGGKGRKVPQTVPPAAKTHKASMSPVTVSVPPPQLYSLQRLARTANFSQAMLNATRNAAQLGYGFPRGGPLRAPSPCAASAPFPADATAGAVGAGVGAGTGATAPAPLPPAPVALGAGVKREGDDEAYALFAGTLDDSAVNYGGGAFGLMSPHGDPFALACGTGAGGAGTDADTAVGLFGPLDGAVDEWAGMAGAYDLASPPTLRQRRRSGEGAPVPAAAAAAAAAMSPNNSSNGCLLMSLDLACSTAMAGTAQGPGADTLGRAPMLHARSGTAVAELSPSLSCIKIEPTGVSSNMNSNNNDDNDGTAYQQQQQPQQQQQQQQQEFSPPQPAQRTTRTGRQQQQFVARSDHEDELCCDCGSSDTGTSCGGAASDELGFDRDSDALVPPPQPQPAATATTGTRHGGAATQRTAAAGTAGGATVLVSSAPMYGHGYADMAAERADVLGLVGATLGAYIDLTHPASIVPEVIQPMVYVNARVLRCPMRGGRSLTCCQPFLLMHIHSARDCWMKSTCHVEDGYAVVSGMRFNWLMFRDELRKLTLAFVARPPVRLRPVQPLGGVETLALMPPLRFLGDTPDAVCARLWDLFKSMPRTFKQLDPVQPSSADLLGVLANDIHPWFSRCGVCVPLPWENYFRGRFDWPDAGASSSASSSTSPSPSGGAAAAAASSSSSGAAASAAGPPEEAGLARVVALIFFSFVCSRAFCMDTTLLIDSLQQRGGVTGSMGTSASVRSATPAPRRVARSSLNGALRRSVSAGNLAPARTAAPPLPSVLEPSEPQPLRAVVAAAAAAAHHHHHHHHGGARRPRSALATAATTIVPPAGAAAAAAAAAATAAAAAAAAAAARGSGEADQGGASGTPQD